MEAAPPPEAAPRSPRSSLFRTLEILLWIGLALFLFNRFGPQIQAWTGIGPSPVGEIPASLAFTTLEGEAFGPEAREGRIQVVTFWATWCRVCRLELPAVQRLHEGWEGSDEVVVVGISIDRGGDALVRSHASEQGLTFPQAMATPQPGVEGGDLRRAFGGIQGVPTTFVVDREGRIRYTLVGVSGPGTLQRAVRRLVEEAASLSEVEISPSDPEAR